MKNTLSTLKKSAVFVALFASASAAYANNSEYTQPITFNAGGDETEVRVDPTINVGGSKTAIDVAPITKSNAAAHAAAGDVNSKIDIVNEGDETELSATGGQATGGASKVDILNEGSEFDVSNGGVTGTITDKSTIEIDASSNDKLTNKQKQEQTNKQKQEQINKQNQKTVVDASSKNKLDQKTEVDASSNNKLDQKTDVDTSDSGNSKNKNTQQTNVGGNNSSYSSYNKSGAATNIPQAAAILATKSCVSSLNVGIGGGNVYAGYGGLSFAYVGSGAVELKGVVTIGEGDDAKQVEANYTIPELAAMTPQNRTPIFNTLKGSDPALATCLIGEQIKQDNFLTKTYEQATKVANINADAHVNGIVIQAEAKMFIASLEAKNNIDVQRIITLGEAFNAGVRHFCGLEAVVLNQADGSQIIHKDTLPIREEGHESCEQVVWGIYGELTDNRPVAEKPDFTKYLKGKHAAPKR